MLRIRPYQLSSLHATTRIFNTRISSNGNVKKILSKGNCRGSIHSNPACISPSHVNLGSISYFSNLPPPRGNNKLRVLTTVGAGAAVLASKGKYILGALKLTKFASLGSMFLSVGAYSMVFGLPYAAGMVGQIVLHESGHALAMKHYGIPFSPMIFIPFVGASVAMNRNPHDAYQEAMIAFAGPVMGTVGATGMSFAGSALDSQLCYALADFGYMINLFNMLPIGMMDGGRICGALSPYAGVAGLGIGGMLIYNGVIQNPIFYLVMLGGTYTTFMRFYDPGNLPLNYYRITNGQKVRLTGGYFGLIGLLISGMAMNARSKKSPQEIQYVGDYHQEQFWTDD